MKTRFFPKFFLVLGLILSASTHAQIVCKYVSATPTSLGQLIPEFQVVVPGDKQLNIIFPDQLSDVLSVESYVIDIEFQSTTLNLNQKENTLNLLYATENLVGHETMRLSENSLPHEMYVVLKVENTSSMAAPSKTEDLDNTYLSLSIRGFGYAANDDSAFVTAYYRCKTQE